jgi:hypothetical protein
MPDVSRAQQRLMFAAAEGRSDEVPQSVGEEFVAADKARGPTKLPERVSPTKARAHVAALRGR